MTTSKGPEYPNKKNYRATRFQQNFTENINNDRQKNGGEQNFNHKLERPTKDESKTPTVNFWEKILENSPLALFLALTPVIISLTTLYVADQQSKEKTLSEYVEFVKSLFFDVYYSDGKKPRIPSVSISNFVSSKTVSTLKIFEKSKEQGKLLNFLKQSKIGFLPSSDDLLDPKSMDIPKEMIDIVKYAIQCPLDYDKQPKEEHPRINNPCLLTGINLSKINLNGQDLRFIVLKKAKLQGIQLNGTFLDRANLREADLSKARLNKASLIFADLTSAQLEGAKMIKANLGNAILNNANLSSLDLKTSPNEQTDLKRADLSQAKLVEANLRGADLRGADLRGADLRGADLRGANLRGADLRSADLRGADLRSADLWKANLIGANLRGADLRGVNLNFANLSFANLGSLNTDSFDSFTPGYPYNQEKIKGKSFKLQPLDKTNFLWFDISKIVPFSYSQFVLQDERKNTNLSNATLRGTILKGAILNEVNFYYSSLQGAKLYVKYQKVYNKDLIWHRLWQSLQFYNYDSELYINEVEKIKTISLLCQTILPENEIDNSKCPSKP